MGCLADKESRLFGFFFLLSSTALSMVNHHELGKAFKRRKNWETMSISNLCMLVLWYYQKRAVMTKSIDGKVFITGYQNGLEILSWFQSPGYHNGDIGTMSTQILTL